MNNPHLYRRFNLLRLGGIPPHKPVGGFVVGVPTKDVRTFQTENPTVAIDGVFLKLLFPRMTKCDGDLPFFVLFFL